MVAVAWWWAFLLLFIHDCLHLQLYRDSKDRYKQGQTKASLSLQHFLAVESGFTLDKESNTIAIICQDVTVVLAFDTRERLIQWQVKIANNLGEDQQFLIQIASAPSRAKIATGPARLHVQEYRFCLTVGVPPRLIGFWEISQLRRYGVVENRFCFEGGSRCGRGEGVYVLMTDQGEEICRSLTLAAEGKLATRRSTRSSSKVLDSPRRMRSEMRFSELGCADLHQESAACCGCPSCHNGDDNLWPSTETRPDTCDYGDTTSVAEYTDSHNQDGRVWTNEHTLERCMSCISKLGAMSRSSTAANTPGTGFTPAWTMEPNSISNYQDIQQNSCSGSNQSSIAEYSTPRNTAPETRSVFSSIEKCNFCPPSRPPKPLQLISSQNSSPLKKKSKKPPMPLPTPQQPPICSCHHRDSSTPNVNPYDNYDIPKNITSLKDDYDADEHYDTPKSIKESLATLNCYGNYDTPPSTAALPQPLLQTTMRLRNNAEAEEWRPVICPCQRMFGWAENWMILPYCKRGNGIENTSLSFHKVKLDGEGKMPVANSSGEIAVYATVDLLKKARDKEERNAALASANKNDESVSVITADDQTSEDYEGGSNYVNVECSEMLTQDQIVSVPHVAENISHLNYANMDFAQSLEYYENARDLVSKTGIKHLDDKMQNSMGENSNDEPFITDKNGVKFCYKCGHPCKPPSDPNHLQETDGDKKPNVLDDYLMMEPGKTDGSMRRCLEQNFPNSSSTPVRSVNFPGYLPMSPIPVGTSVPTTAKPDLIKHHFNQEMGLLVEKAASVPSLSVSSLNRARKRSDSEFIRVPGSAMMGVNQPLSATASPYLRRHLISSSTDSKDDSRSCSSYVRKRSSSADSTRYIDNLESITERTVSSSSSTQVNNSDNSKNTSVDSLSSQTISLKKVDDTINCNTKSDNSGEVEINVRESEANTKEELVGNDSDSMKSDSLRTLVQDCYQQGPSTPVHIRRSSSIPCKSGHNRDSSSSNDSGVSIASLKHRGADFAEFELPLTTSKSARRHHAVMNQRMYYSNHGNCLHASLPRRSKSSDPLQELTFQFQKAPVPAKSSSAEAEVPVYSTKREIVRGCLSPAGDSVIATTYLDSRSTSSGTSDMSDYFETLSLSSYSSSDTPDSLRLGRPPTTTLRPRSGKEYHKIDRYILDGDNSIKKPQFGTITTVPEKSETIPHGCSSGVLKH